MHFLITAGCDGQGPGGSDWQCDEPKHPGSLGSIDGMPQTSVVLVPDFRAKHLQMAMYAT